MRGVGRLSLSLAAAVLIAGCGGDGGDDAPKDITAVATTALTSRDPQVRCAETVTKHFVATVYGSQATCRRAVSKPDPSKPATGAKVTGIAVDGNRATADVATVGGTSDRSHGQLRFAKEAGHWKIDGLGVDFLRSRLALQVQTSRDGPFADAGVRRCFASRMARLADAEFLAVAYAAIARRDPHPTFLRILSDCSTSARDGAGISVLRRQFEAGIREAAAKDGTPPKAVDCVLRGLRSSISDTEIVQLSSDRKELTKRVATAMIDCDAAG